MKCIHPTLFTVISEIQFTPDLDHIIPNEASPLPSLGRTTRSIHPPSYLKDYNCTLPKLNSSISTPNSQHSLTSIISDHNHFKIKDLGRLHYFLGLEILYRQNDALISQRRFTTNLLKEFDVMDCKVTNSPLDSTEKLTAADGKLLSDPTHYMNLIGNLNFLTNTRINISFSVQHLSQFMQSPRDTHLRSAYHVLRRSISGYLVLMGDCPISWKSKKQVTVSLSSAEAEYMAVR
uniref:Reverse transcriptase Ty1/copia-type domain-containing protein n=1 Tax=Solanum lycopersicum TaxID=4081 RepID=A0A3Q7F2Z3_SOLLC